MRCSWSTSVPRARAGGPGNPRPGSNPGLADDPASPFLAPQPGLQGIRRAPSGTRPVSQELTGLIGPRLSTGKLCDGHARRGFADGCYRSAIWTDLNPHGPDLTLWGPGRSGPDPFPA